MPTFIKLIITLRGIAPHHVIHQRFDGNAADGEHIAFGSPHTTSKNNNNNTPAYLGLWSSSPTLGAWGRGAPLRLHYDNESQTFTGEAQLPCDDEDDVVVAAQQLLPKELEFRLVVLGTEPSSFGQLPILALDASHSMPMCAPLQHEMVGGQHLLRLYHNVEEDEKKALGTAPFFVCAATHFSQLTLMQQQQQHKDEEEVALLSLTFYGNDPRLLFDHDAWRETSMASGIDLHGRTSTTAFSVSSVSQVAASGACSWSYHNLPHSRSHTQTTPPSTCTTQMLHLSQPPMLNLSLREVGLTNDDGCCGARSQHCWTTEVRLSSHTPGGVLVQIELPMAQNDSHTATVLRGSVLLMPCMFQSGTNGLLTLPVRCTADGDVVEQWTTLFVQYLVAFPTIHGSNHLRVLRSLESFGALSHTTLVGHRGLGKTHTRSKPGITKMAENTIPSFTLAKQRGCSMVEFDVMLTRDDVPVIVHDPIVEVLAQGNDGRGALPVPVAVHELRKSELDAVAKRACIFGHHYGVGVANRLKNVVRRLVLPPHSQQRMMNLTNDVPTLSQVLHEVPEELAFNIEVKYPFQPHWDANMFQQTTAFEVNHFVDVVLKATFDYAASHPRRQIAFSSFDPDVCLALAKKQSRFHVLFLSSSQDLDIKDYRSFFVEGALQFAELHHLSGISIDANSLCLPTQAHFVQEHRSSPLAAVVDGVQLRLEPQPHREDGLHVKNLYTPVQGELAAHDDAWDAFNTTFGTSIVAAAHRRGLKVWTWGDSNSNHLFAYLQGVVMGVDGVITDNVTAM